MNKDKVLSLMGLATKAGKLKSGEFCVETELKKNSAKLVIVANDASANTKKGYTDACAYRKVPIAVYSTKEEIGSAIGKESRAACVITDEGFAKGIIKAIGNNQSDSEVVE